MSTSLQSLRLYLTYFAGRSGRWVQAYAQSSTDRDTAWAGLLEALGLSEAAEGDEVTATGVDLAGTVELQNDAQWRHDLLIRMNRPAAGLAAISVWGVDGHIQLTGSLFDGSVGDGGGGNGAGGDGTGGDGVSSALVEQVRSEWQIWLDEHAGRPS
jgi:hypothetical protein